MYFRKDHADLAKELECVQVAYVQLLGQGLG
jgi:hypothetical protein